MRNTLKLLEQLKPADRLVIPKSDFELVQHHVIYLGKDNYGNRKYIENAIGKGVQIISEAYLFRNGYKITRIERFIGNEYQRNAALEFAYTLLGKDYDLLDFNCEHYANLVQHKESYSKQVENGIKLGLGIFAFAVVVELFKSK